MEPYLSDRRYILYTQLVSWENLYLAYRRASAGKRGHANVASFEYRLEDNLLELQRELTNQTYKPGQYDSFYIHEPKRRLISAAPFRDRVVHHALCNIIEPLFERSFCADSFANRIGQGTHRALDHCQSYSRCHAYVLQCDIKQFFPSIDHQILLNILQKKVEDVKTFSLAQQILNSGIGVLKEAYDTVYFHGDSLLAPLRPRGLPIGNLTSQFWANVYLNPFDHFVKRELRCPGYVRYVDDFLLFSNEKVNLHHWKKAVIHKLEQFRLTIHAGAHPRQVGEGIPFLGFQIYPQYRRLKRRKGIYYQRKLKQLLRDLDNGEITRQDLQQSIQGWVNHTSYANTVGLRQKMLTKVNHLDFNERKR